MEGRSSWKAWGAVAAVGVVVVVCGGLLRIDRLETHNRRVFDRIRAGEMIEASSLEFTGQRQLTRLRDPASVDYFMAALRSARRFNSKHDSFGGISYTANVRLADGNMLTLEVTVHDHDRGMLLYTPLEYLGINDPDYYSIAFPDPMPKALSDVLKKLRR